MKALVLSPHPDDEAIGCGGTLRKHVDEGIEVHVVFLTSGEAGGHGVADAGRVREMEAKEAASILGIAGMDFWREPDGKLRAGRALEQKLTALIDELEPGFIYTPHPCEMHPDHRATTRLLGRVVGDSDVVIRTYEVWTPMREMSHIEDVSEVMDLKLAAVSAYKSQCDVLRFDEAIAGLNRFRGEMHSWPGGPYAEVFGDL